MKNPDIHKGLTTAQRRALTGVLDELRDERFRQAGDLQFTPEHDDAHDPEQMLEWARVYTKRADRDLQSWPSDQNVSEARDNLVKAAALLVATIERLDREVSRG